MQEYHMQNELADGYGAHSQGWVSSTILVLPKFMSWLVSLMSTLYALKPTFLVKPPMVYGLDSPL